MGSILGQFLLDLLGQSGNAKLSLSTSLYQYSTLILIIFIFMFIFTSIFKAALKKTAKGGTWEPSKKSYVLSERGGMQRGKNFFFSSPKGYVAV
jgi:hypothetical protein